MTALMEPPKSIAAEVPHLSPSIAKILLSRSPLHAWDAHRLGGNHKAPPTDAMTGGRLYDRLLFGVGPDIVRVDAPDWRTKAAKDARDAAEAEDSIPVLAGKLAECQAVVNAWQDQFADRDIEFTGISQRLLQWRDEGTPCKGYADHVIVGRDGITIYDLKTCQDASPDACTRAMIDKGSDIQHAAYVEGAQMMFPTHAGRVRMFFLYCEVNRPYAVNVVEPSGQMMQLGFLKWRKAVRVWGECLRTGYYPGFSGVTTVDCKSWMLDNAMDEEIADGR